MKKWEAYQKNGKFRRHTLVNFPLLNIIDGKILSFYAGIAFRKKECRVVSEAQPGREDKS